MIEVLSPAGNIEALKCAVASRADAVYLGLEQFNARLKADNFSTRNIREWVEFCHFYGVKVYVTINTLIKQKELDSLNDLLVACEDAKVDAIIVTDLAVVGRAKKLCPSVALHASTQMGIHNYLGAKLLEKLGFSRVVLARECKLEDIKEIKANTNLEIEYFVHGAMCVAFSGQCLLSSMASGNSGNRGLCLQPCRKEYSESMTGKNGYLISPKDQCLIEHIKELEATGVDSLKIEGRLKSSEYVGLVTAKYRAAVDGLKILPQDYSEMKRVFNRGGFSEGYSFSSKNQILYTLVQNNMGEPIGEIVNVVKSKDYYKIDIKTNFDLKNGDGIKIFAKGKEVGGFEVNIIEKQNNLYKLYSKNAFKKGDKVHITFDSELSKKYNDPVLPKLILDINVQITSSNVILSCTYKNQKITFEQTVQFEFAQNVITSSEEVKNQFSKTGGTPFEFKNINVTLSENLFIPKSSLNNLRRNFIRFLQTKIAEINVSIWREKNKNYTFYNDLDNCFFNKVVSSNASNIVIANQIDLNDLNDESVMKIVLNWNNFDEKVLNYAKNHNNLFVKLPKIAMKADLKILLDFVKSLPKNVGIYADNLWQYYLAVESGRAVIGGIGLNIFNSEVVRLLGLKCFVASPELCKLEIEELGLPCSVYSFGYLPVMYFCHCPVQHYTSCNCTDCKYGDYSLKDIYGEYKIVRIKMANCYFEMLNSSCHLIERDKLVIDNFACIDVTQFENSEQIVNNYLNNSCNFLNNSIKLTRGHYARGVK